MSFEPVLNPPRLLWVSSCPLFTEGVLSCELQEKVHVCLGFLGILSFLFDRHPNAFHDRSGAILGVGVLDSEEVEDERVKRGKNVPLKVGEEGSSTVEDVVCHGVVLPPVG